MNAIHNHFATLAGIVVSLGLYACDKKTETAPPPAVSAPATSNEKAAAKVDEATKPDEAKVEVAVAGEAKVEAAVEINAVVGKAAPDFTLKDLDGASVSLSQFKGKTVVLEWFNPDCPFVVRTHNEGPLKSMAADFTKSGGVWLAINSGAAGKQGAGIERNKSALAEYKLEHPILLDEDGVVGKQYHARNTPGMYVIDANGVLAYAGAIDNAPNGTPPDEGYRNHVAEALTDVAAGIAVRVTETKQYGCGVKYSN